MQEVCCRNDGVDEKDDDREQRGGGKHRVRPQAVRVARHRRAEGEYSAACGQGKRERHGITMRLEESVPGREDAEEGCLGVDLRHAFGEQDGEDGFNFRLDGSSATSG